MREMVAAFCLAMGFLCLVHSAVTCAINDWIEPLKTNGYSINFDIRATAIIGTVLVVLGFVTMRGVWR